ncbi:hypothetical protein EHS39_36280 [Ensifer sp. MPMI2T]|nr:hypothetical protein EHS39_36280 [Ensifer sp. MPMI2T]
MPPSDDESQKRKRDDFTAATKRLLAERVGYLCSNPECRALTIGPRLGTEGSVNTGVAAHITAAASGPGAARFDPSLSPDERKHYTNGIWLCAVHAHQIDHDEKHFTTEKLRGWKQAAESFAAKQMASGASIVAPGVQRELIDELAQLSEALGLPKEDDFPRVREQVELAAQKHVEKFKSADGYPIHPVKLALRAESLFENRKSFDVDRLATAVSRLRKIKLVAPLGTGKSTTLIQLADGLIEQKLIPVVIPLAEWSVAGKDLLQWAASAHSFAGLSSSHLKFMAAHGEVVLLLDGLNELPDTGHTRLVQELKTLERDFPLLMLVVSTRRQASNIPVGEATIEIQKLSQDQQEEIAHSIRGEAGLIMLDHAWKTSGLRDLVSIPFYLSALLQLASQGQLPETKEEIVRALALKHESSWDRKEVVDQVLEGQHVVYLEYLAVEATSSRRPLSRRIARMSWFQRRRESLRKTAKSPGRLRLARCLKHLSGSTPSREMRQIRSAFSIISFRNGTPPTRSRDGS